MERRNPNSASSSRADRKTIERNRRNHMKSLFAALNSLVQHQNPTEAAPLPDQLEAAAKYIKGLQMRLEKLREKKENMVRVENLNSSMRNGMAMSSEAWVPRINIHQSGSALKVNLVTASSFHDYQPLFKEIVRMLNEEGAEVVCASFSVAGDNVFHTILSEVQDSALMLAQARISERLQKIICIGYAY